MCQVSWIDYGGKRVLRRSLEPGACYFERSFATHPWIVEYSCNNNNNNNNDQNDNNTSESNRETNGLADEGESQDEATTASPSSALREDDGHCCVVRLGDSMAAAQFSGSLIWNPARKTLSVQSRQE